MPRKTKLLEEDAEHIAQRIKHHIDKDSMIYCLANNDADGIASAAILTDTITKMGGKIHVRCVKTPSTSEISGTRFELLILCDIGGQLPKELTKKLLEKETIIIDHHENPQKEDETIHTINPHKHNIDGTTHISASGLTYLVTKHLINEPNHTTLALVGASGDLQDREGFHSLNLKIVQEAENRGKIIKKFGIRFTAPHQPLAQALAHIIKPALPKITGNPEHCLKIIQRCGLPPTIQTFEINKKDEKNLAAETILEALSNHAPPEKVESLIGPVYTIENPPHKMLSTTRSFATLLDACAANNKPGLGITLCIGNPKSFESAEKLMEKYLEKCCNIANWLTANKSKIVEHKNISTITYSNNKNTGIVASMMIELGLQKRQVCVAIQKSSQLAYISARTTRDMVLRGVNLAEALGKASQAIGGSGGGHNIAAGASIDQQNIQKFVWELDRSIGEQLK